MGAYRVFNGHKTMADPASRGAVSADVRERPLKVTIRSAERHLLYCLVQNQVLQKALFLSHSIDEIMLVRNFLFVSVP